jgi:pyridoxine 5-phosphate synthase
MTSLSVNVNKFALLRNSRGRDYPSVVGMARRAIGAGVQGITVHPRPDERHIRRSDVPELSSLVGAHKNVEFNIEGYPTRDFLDLVVEVGPDQCTLVPDAPDQLTSDHGWKLEAHGDTLVPIIDRLKTAEIRVSLFLDPVGDDIDRASAVGTDRIEFYTEPYAEAFGTGAEDSEWKRFADGAAYAREVGLGVNAGHDLNLDNLPRFLTIPRILEVSIGHAIVVESFDHGFEETLRRYLAIIQAGV